MPSPRAVSTEEGARRWKEAYAFGDLCELTAQFIEGTSPFYPAYGAETVDEETASIVPYLVALNRAGFLTNCSQPGVLQPGNKQRAFVEGFVLHPTAVQLGKLALSSDLHISVFAPGEWGGYPTPVTVDDFRPFTWVGHYDEPVIQQFADCCNDWLRQLLLETAWYAVVVDLRWGRTSHLWELLTNALCLSPHPNPDPHVFDRFARP